MKKIMLIVISICTVILMSLLVLSGCAATVNNKPDSTLTDNSDSQVTIISDQTAVVTNIGDQTAAVTNISDQTATKFKYDEEIQKIVRDYKNEGTIISDEQVQKLNELYVNQKMNPAYDRLLYQEGIIIGIIDPNAPKLDSATAKDIIAKSNDFKKILSEFDKVQKYPDVVGGSGMSVLEYQLSEYEKILIIIEQEYIVHSVYNPDGTVKSKEKLFEGNRYYSNDN